MPRERTLRMIAAMLSVATGLTIFAGGAAFGQGAPGGAKPPQVVVSTVVSGSVAVAAFARAMTFNAAAGSFIKLALRDNVAFSSIANPTLGQQLTLLICQDNFGARTLA